MCVCGLGCVRRRTVPRGTAQTRLSQPACRLLARCRAGAAAAGVARVRALLQGRAPVVGLPRAQAPGQKLVVAVSPPPRAHRTAFSLRCSFLASRWRLGKGGPHALVQGIYPDLELR